MTRKFFGTDGIRGRTNEMPMTAAMAQRIGQAAGAHFLRGDHQHRVVIGKDTRLSSYMIEYALVAGFASVGADVLLLGPVLLVLGVMNRGEANPDAPKRTLVPWFIIGFFLVAIVRSIGLVPDAAVTPTRTVATVLTIGAMAALGLGVDLKTVRHAGPRIVVAILISLSLLFGMSLTLARALPA